jgi:hypothetical protein
LPLLSLQPTALPELAVFADDLVETDETFEKKKVKKARERHK